MYQCAECRSMFTEPAGKTVILEDYYGVGSLFPDHHYGMIDVCPECGSEEIDEIACDFDCAFCDYYSECTSDYREEVESVEE